VGVRKREWKKQGGVGGNFKWALPKKAFKLLASPVGRRKDRAKKDGKGERCRSSTGPGPNDRREQIKGERIEEERLPGKKINPAGVQGETTNQDQEKKKKRRQDVVDHIS